jgi:hypothetical protein
MYQMTAMATGQRLRTLPERLRFNDRSRRANRADCRMFLDAWRRVLDREEPDYKS